MELAYSLAGLVVGFIVGLTGIGGGALMTPILILGFGIPPLVAVSTDLLYAAITKSVGVVNYATKGLINRPVVVLLAMGSLPSSLLTLLWLSRLEDLASIEQLMNLTLGVSLVLTSFAVFLRQAIRRWAERKAQHPAATYLIKMRPAITLASGVLLGVLVTLSSVGAGALGTAILILLYPGMRMQMIVATDLVHAVLLTAVSGIGHYQLGSVDLSLLLYLLLGSLPGVTLGSYLGARLSPRLMQPIIGSLLLGIGLKFVLAA